ncbi:hypothetical protein SAMN05661080_05050 [Modestobacter sp. DSM 44400]|uniref:DUF1440 domain-containing protein n=1 Tax=Modestobacter sp. DSM 44400 TaxID=1550230 RepID=UPI00089A44B4|nr:DUF1440 domain-containing protein [Modestobacter sp. DSM 44400]SDY92841.1 hypothetical protein SAMN05661080_05050 [Modestobacter sp. DSM 44400]
MPAVTDVAEDLAVAAVAGYLATKAMEPVSMRLYELESEEDRQHEDAVRPGPPYELAAKKIAASLEAELHGRALERASLAMHYELALSWSPVYGVLRRTRDIHPALAGLGTGAAMSLVADEAMAPLLGYSAPNRAYPLATHLRGFLAHLVFGLAVAATTETLWGLRGRRP